MKYQSLPSDLEWWLHLYKLKGETVEQLRLGGMQEPHGTWLTREQVSVECSPRVYRVYRGCGSIFRVSGTINIANHRLRGLAKNWGLITESDLRSDKGSGPGVVLCCWDIGNLLLSDTQQDICLYPLLIGRPPGKRKGDEYIAANYRPISVLFGFWNPQEKVGIFASFMVHLHNGIVYIFLVESSETVNNFNSLFWNQRGKTTS